MEVLVRRRKWANHRAYDRLPGRRLELSGENVSGKAAARCDVEDSERASVAAPEGEGSTAGREGGEKRWTVESELRSHGRAWVCISLANTQPHSAQKAPSLVAGRWTLVAAL
jgi:hypothetical protein